MSNSIFCPNCGMLKSNCTCKSSGKKKNEGPTNLFSFSKRSLHPFWMMRFLKFIPLMTIS